jgi:hypothetical protein
VSDPYPAQQVAIATLVGLLTPEPRIALPSRHMRTESQRDNGLQKGLSYFHSVTAAGPSRICTGVPCSSALQQKRPTTSVPKTVRLAGLEPTTYGLKVAVKRFRKRKPLAVSRYPNLPYPTSLLTQETDKTLRKPPLRLSGQPA